MSWDPPPPGGNPPPYGQPPGGFGQPPQNGAFGPPPGGPGAFGQPPAGPAFYGGPGMGLTPHRGPLILVLSIVSLFVMFLGCSMCGPLCFLSLGLSIPAIVMGRNDLSAIDSGAMDPTGRDVTNAGMIMGMVSTGISVLLGILMIIFVILYGGLVGASILAGA